VSTAVAAGAGVGDEVDVGVPVAAGDGVGSRGGGAAPPTVGEVDGVGATCGPVPDDVGCGLDVC
jgi:hypothetical protein